MKPSPFDYHRPDSVDEAATLLAELDDARLLAGGQSLVPMLNLRLAYFDHLVDISGLTELAGIEARDDTLRIGSAATQSAAERSDEVRRSAPLLAKALPLVGHFPLRNRGTVGGSVAHADPAAEIPAVLVALGGSVEAVSTRGRRTIPAADLFLGTWWTSLEEDEILTAVDLPRAGARHGSAIEEVARRHGDFAIAGAAVAVETDGDGVVTTCGIGLFGLGPTPVLSVDAERLVCGRAVEAIGTREVGVAAAEGLDEIPDDLNATADQRRRLAEVVVARALTTAIEELRHG